jgi:hypothetical protein
VSWDVLIFNGPADARTVDELPIDFAPPALRAAADIVERLSELPGIDLSDPTWGHLTGRTWSIDLNIGRGDPVDAIMLHVRGSGDDVLPVIAQIVAATGGRALDVSTGEFLTGDVTGVGGWHGFQQHRDQVLHHDR